MANLGNIPKILLVGKLRSGKSTIAKYLVQQHGFAEYAFGDELKRFANEIFAISPVMRGNGKPRAIYQRFGELCREIDPLIWVRYVDAKITAETVARGIVVSDGRQPHEVEWARAKGFVVVRVTAPDAVRIARAKRLGDRFNAENLAHDTEQHVDRFEVDYEIINDGSLDDLKRKVDEMLQIIRQSI